MSLITSKGLPVFNMNAVAALAAVDVPLLQKHFENRSELLIGLFKRASGRVVGDIIGLISQVKFASGEDVIAMVRRHIDKIVEMQLAEPGFMALRLAVRAIPRVAAVDERLNEGFASAVELALRSRVPEMPARRARTVAITIVEAATALVEHSARHPKEAREFSREIAPLIVGYIREVLTPTEMATQPG